MMAKCQAARAEQSHGTDKPPQAPVCCSCVTLGNKKGVIMKFQKVSLSFCLVFFTISIFNLSGCATPSRPAYAPSRPAYTPPPPKAPTATANVREISRVTHNPAPENWARTSPDGTQLLFHTYDRTKEGGEGSSIVLIKIGKAGRKLMAGPYANFPAWYPCGKKFIYKYLKMQKPILVRSPIGGVGMTFISPSALGDADGQPDVSHDGKRIALQTKLGDSYHICTVNADGSNFTLYTEGYSPRWNQDDTKIAFDREVGEKFQCFIFDIVSGQVTQLTTDDSKNFFPVWSPDGRRIAFISNRDGKFHLYAMKSDGSQVTQLTKGGSQEYFHDWSIDGYIYFSSDAGAPLAQSDNPWAWNYSDIWRLKPILSD